VASIPDFPTPEAELESLRRVLAAIVVRYGERNELRLSLDNLQRLDPRGQIRQVMTPGDTAMIIIYEPPMTPAEQFDRLFKANAGELTVDERKAYVLRQYKFGNLTRLGVANMLMRMGLTPTAAVEFSNEIHGAENRIDVEDLDAESRTVNVTFIDPDKDREAETLFTRRFGQTKPDPQDLVENVIHGLKPHPDFAEPDFKGWPPGEPLPAEVTSGDTPSGQPQAMSMTDAANAVWQAFAVQRDVFGIVLYDGHEPIEVAHEHWTTRPEASAAADKRNLEEGRTF
jgi:hypothetical protein